MNANEKAADPNTVTGTQAACWAVSQGVGKVPVVGWFGSAAVNLVCGLSERRKDYMEILPLLKHEMGRETPIRQPFCAMPRS